MSNLLIVESKADELFVKRLLQELGLASEVSVDTPVCCRIDEYQCLNGLSETQLIRKLKEVAVEIEKRGTERVGILLDADKDGVDGKVDLINNSLQKIDEAIWIDRTNQWIYSQGLDVKISCHILNVDGYGELETLLRKIKSSNSIFADCLRSWRECLSVSGNSISDKEFDKFWLSIYQRFDACTKKERKQAGRKCCLEASLEKNIWDFSSSHLDELKEYLSSFV